jgi:hypothetical protein
MYERLDTIDESCKTQSRVFAKGGKADSEGNIYSGDLTAILEDVAQHTVDLQLQPDQLPHHSSPLSAGEVNTISPNQICTRVQL